MAKEKTCWECAYRGVVPGSAHSRCAFDWEKSDLKMPKGDTHGGARGWYMFPLNYDPVWMTGECPAFSTQKDPKMVKTQHDPIAELCAILGSVGR